MKPCPSCGGDCGYTKKKGCQYQSGESEWVGLTEDEIKECFAITPDQFLPWQIYKRIEMKLKERNT